VLAAADFTRTSGGEQATFWILAPVAVLAAIGMVLARNAVHAALLLVANFFCLAVFYVLQDAPFLGAVQVVVYAGAIMVLFLFVLMLVGVDSSDSLVETLRGQRIAAVILGVGFAGMLAFPSGTSSAAPGRPGPTRRTRGANVQAIGRLLIHPPTCSPSRSCPALLFVAAVGAMCSATRNAPSPRHPEDLARRRIAAAGRSRRCPAPAVRQGGRRRHPRGSARWRVAPDSVPPSSRRSPSRAAPTRDRRWPAMNPANYLILSALLFTIGAVGVSCAATRSWCSCPSS